jgi:hypothetical protein
LNGRGVAFIFSTIKGGCMGSFLGFSENQDLSDKELVKYLLNRFRDSNSTNIRKLTYGDICDIYKTIASFVYSKQPEIIEFFSNSNLPKDWDLYLKDKFVTQLGGQEYHLD